MSISGRNNTEALGAVFIAVAVACCGATDTGPVDAIQEATGISAAYEMSWPFRNMGELRSHKDYVESGTADDNMTVQQNLATPWGGSTAVRRPVLAGENSVGINWNWPVAIQTRAREVWVEVWQRFSETWHVSSPTGGAIDDKTYFWLPNTNVRWELKFMNSDVRVYINNSPVPGGASVKIPGGEANLHDGKWHRVRVHLRMGSSGAYRFWYDDQMLLSAVGFETGNGPSDYFAWCGLGRNVAVREPAFMDFGRMSVWTSDPGW